MSCIALFILLLPGFQRQQWSNTIASPNSPSEANTKFCLALFKKLSDKDTKANVFYSPFSISSALAMVMLGARGNTARQMSEVLCFPGSGQPEQAGEQQSQKQSQMQSQMQSQSQVRSQMTTGSHVQVQQCSRLPQYACQYLEPKNGEVDVHAYFEQLLRELNKPDAKYALSTANRLYGEQSYQFVEEFLEETKKYYKAELESVDFINNAEAVRLAINEWVEKQTQDKIKNLLAKGMLDNRTRLVLVNAIYFKGKWVEPFEEIDTEDAEFRITKNEAKQVKMMYQEKEFHVASIPEVDAQILEMQYVGEDLSMLIILPNDIKDDTTGLEKLERELTYENFEKWTRPGNMAKSEVGVSLPRFKMEKTYRMKDVLTSMGMVDAFDRTKSDFSGMSPAKDLVVSKVIHKSFVGVNEQGTEAAAATGVLIECAGRILPPPIIFNADHPFLFFIRHNPTRTILFAGRYCSPE